MNFNGLTRMYACGWNMPEIRTFLGAIHPFEQRLTLLPRVDRHAN